MITSRKLKIWTLATHSFIVVGFGHGIIFFFLIEILWFPFVDKAYFSLMFNVPFESRLPTVGLTTLLGQIALIVSIVNSNIKAKIGFHIAGLGLFWLSILYFTISLNDNVHFAAITGLPFAMCTFIAFAGKPLKKVYRWAVANY